jgi:hypothetical protein
MPKKKRHHAPQPKPPEQFVTMAKAAKCTDCDSDPAKLRWDGVAWHVVLPHDDECPVRQGRVTRNGIMQSMADALPTLSTPVLVIDSKGPTG